MPAARLVAETLQCVRLQLVVHCHALNSDYFKHKFSVLCLDGIKS